MEDFDFCNFSGDCGDPYQTNYESYETYDYSTDACKNQTDEAGK